MRPNGFSNNAKGAATTPPAGAKLAGILAAPTSTPNRGAPPFTGTPITCICGNVEAPTIGKTCDGYANGATTSSTPAPPKPELEDC